jgi:tetratricopeptide (TPR) repeat protein
VAYNTLSTIYGAIGETARSEEYAQLAYARRARVSERERLFITYQYHDRVTGDLNEAAQTLNVWKHSFPRDWTPANVRSLIFGRLGRFELAIEEAKEAMERNPAHPFPYSNLAYAYRGLNRFDEARQTAERAVAMKIETVPTRRLLYQLALMKGDAEAARGYLTGLREPAREFDLVAAQAQAAAFHGTLREARRLYRQSMDLAERRNLVEIASGTAAHLVWTEALFGSQVGSVAEARSALARAPSPLVRFRAAVALALRGPSSDVDAIVEEASRRYPASTLMRGVYIPIVRAAQALGRGRGPDAVEALQPTLPYETGLVAALIPTYMRGQAYLMARDPEAAGAEFQKVLEHRGSDPFSPVYALAHLGKGRARALAGDVEQSRSAYEAFFALWADADPDIPILRAARAEYKRMESAPPTQ